LTPTASEKRWSTRLRAMWTRAKLLLKLALPNSVSSYPAIGRPLSEGMPRSFSRSSSS
jgi:hypothetical protein